MSSLQGQTIRYKNDLIDSENQFSLHSNILQETIKPDFELHGKYPKGDCVVFASDQLIYD